VGKTFESLQEMFTSTKEIQVCIYIQQYDHFYDTYKHHTLEGRNICVLFDFFTPDILSRQVFCNIKHELLLYSLFSGFCLEKWFPTLQLTFSEQA
jgi:hypothetical protein